MSAEESDVNQRLFRKVALARLSSPDRMDALLGIRRPLIVLAWLGIAIAVTTFLVWGFGARIEQRVSGRCILLSPSGVAEVTSSASGVVSGLHVKLGDTIGANQAVGRIVRAELGDQIKQTRTRLAELERRQEELGRYLQRAAGLGQSARSAENALSQAQVSLAEGKAKSIDARVATERELVAQGLITQRTLLETEEARAAALLEREQLADRAAQTKLGFAEQERQRERDKIAVEFQVNETRRSLEASLDIERQSAPIVSPFAGRVVEVKLENGVGVGFGTPVLLIERTDGAPGDVEAAIYLAGGDGKLVEASMQVEITPDYVKRQEFGFLRARVAAVSDYPVSSPGMRLLVQNDNLVRELSGARSAIFARARLERSSTGKFAWSAAASAPPEVQTGALCRAEVTVSDRPPFALLISHYKRWMHAL